MHDGHSLLAIIPARGGSKGLPNKNIKDCAGKPLIAWTIAAAKEVGSIDDVIVSTDSADIASASTAYGATVPFMRPAHLATDLASMLDVVKHAVDAHLDRNGKPFDYILLLQPTSPLRTAQHIRDAIHHYFRHRALKSDTLASVYPVSEKYRWLMQVPEGEQHIKFCLQTDSHNPRRQLLQPLYLPNGALFIVARQFLDQGFYSPQTLPYVMDAQSSIDIDTNEEFNMAHHILCQRPQADHACA